MSDQVKRALIVGIVKYQAPIQALKGCVNDAKLIESVLRERFGFDDITLLLDEQATRAGILSAFEALATATQPGDVVVFYYAGHGSQRVDREGDEPSGFDSTLVTVDSRFGPGVAPELNLDITDDEVFLWLQELGKKTSAITVIVDACHSGTITRDVDDLADGFQTRGVPADTTPPTTPSPIAPALWPMLGGRTPRGTGAPGSWVPVQDHYTVLSGCRDDQLSGEFRFALDHAGNTVVHGALTYYLADALRQATAGSTYRSVFEQVAAAVTPLRGGKQHPQIEGKADRVLFGLKEIPPMRYLRLTNVSDDGKTVTIGAGAAQGLTVGTTLALYPPGTVVTGDVAALATATITTVTAVLSSATVARAEGSAAVPLDARAVVTNQPLGDARRPVRLDTTVVGATAEQIAAMRGAIEASPVLRLTESATAETLTVRLWPSDGASAPPRWAIVSTDGAPIAPLKPLDGIADTVANLETRARHALALALSNTNALSKLVANPPTVQLLRERADETWEVATAGPGGLPVYAHGARVGLRLTNNTDKPLYFSVVDFGLVGTVTPLYPPEGVAEAIKPRDPFNLFTVPGTRVAFELPDVYPYVADGALPVRHDGIETLKIFATTAPASFAFLQQVGTRSVEGLSAVQQLFMAAVPATRESKPETPLLGPTDDWTTVVASFLLTRAGP